LVIVQDVVERIYEDNKIREEDRAVHDWYRFVLSFPPHIVRTYLERFGIKASGQVLDPFCGTGTTLVECKKLGVSSVGVEANPMAFFATRTKINWHLSIDRLLSHAAAVAKTAITKLKRDGIEDDPVLPLFRSRTRKLHAPGDLQELPEENRRLLLAGSISPLPLHKVLLLRDVIHGLNDGALTDHELLALAKVIVFSASNLQFGPEVGVGPAKEDGAVISPWLRSVRMMADDIRTLAKGADAVVHHGDAREISALLQPRSIDAVITSPPYPNEKDYTRTTRLESVILGFINNKDELRSLKRSLVRSNTRGVYTGDTDDAMVSEHKEIQGLAQAIEQRRVELRKTSGFERQYARVTRLYFGGMARHLADLRAVLKPGAHLAYVVGDQASYLQVMIRTGRLLADIARDLGYQVEAVDLFRTRLATATRQALREEVLVLRWPR
jgi:hypothetical protein